MATIPADAQILTLDEALTYFRRWTPSDRATARAWVEKTGVTEFYVPSSGGYVACHGGPNRSRYRDMAVNGLLMHVGFLHAWPNDADIGGDRRIQLSHFRGDFGSASRSRAAANAISARTCPHCFLVAPSSVEVCDNCGHRFAQVRAAPSGNR